eukprot:CAMPEP_0114260022 /NCGR_PEP_ID=MMETSP0058-20121206/20224_1 /TAXON_ID=36894 /ORGANISM="Pyramimonas parkeae, CCMP726" /LENGTH=308 /DNA_ID=CAMNT_0001375147 /DNA_START=307 /DNA_END=1235 /DNA_ORIENTATION=+
MAPKIARSCLVAIGQRPPALLYSDPDCHGRRVCVEPLALPGAASTNLGGLVGAHAVDDVRREEAQPDGQARQAGEEDDAQGVVFESLRSVAPKKPHPEVGQHHHHQASGRVHPHHVASSDARPAAHRAGSGDADREERQEQSALRVGEAVPAGVLVVKHHGSVRASQRRARCGEAARAQQQPHEGAHVPARDAHAHHPAVMIELHDTAVADAAVVRAWGFVDLAGVAPRRASEAHEAGHGRGAVAGAFPFSSPSSVFLCFFFCLAAAELPLDAAGGITPGSVMVHMPMAARLARCNTTTAAKEAWPVW